MSFFLDHQRSIDGVNVVGGGNEGGVGILDDESVSVGRGSKGGVDGSVISGRSGGENIDEKNNLLNLRSSLSKESFFSSKNM